MGRGVSGGERSNRAGGGWRWLRAPFTHRGLAGFALLGFFLISLAATGLGFADLRLANTDADALPPMELAVTLATTLFVVSAMVVALHVVVDWREGFFRRLVALVFYLFFALWSVGFGYGFFWKELAGREFTAEQFRGAIAGVAASTERAGAALAAAESATLDAARLARVRAETEAREGRTCANRPLSSAGEGPLMRSRFAFADRAEGLGQDMRAQWTAPLEQQRAHLAASASALATGRVPANAGDDARERLERLASAMRLDPGERRALFAQTHDDARAFAAQAETMRALYAESFAGRLDALAAEVGADPARPGAADPARADDPAYCWDVVLHDRLKTAAAQVRGVGAVEVPAFDFLEGPKATRAAFFGLVDWLAGLAGIEREGRGAGVPFDDRALLALFASLAVDLGILFLTVMQAPRRPPRPKKPRKVSAGEGAPTPPVLKTILE